MASGMQAQQTSELTLDSLSGQEDQPDLSSSVVPSENNILHDGAEFSTDVGFLFAKGGFNVFTPEIGIGKRINKNFYAGVGVGAQVPMNGGNTLAMLSADLKYYYPLSKIPLTPGGLFRVGYAGDFMDYSYVIIQIMPTVQIPLSKRTDLNVGIGYTQYVAVDNGGGAFGAFAIKAGFRFHKSTDGSVRARRMIPTRDSGVQLTLEGDGLWGMSSGWGGGGALTFTYKLNPYFSLGLGVGYEKCGNLEAKDKYVDNGFKEAMGLSEEPFNNTKLFLRGTYRPLNKRSSPLVSCDFGVHFNSQLGTDEDNSWIFKEGYAHSAGIFVTPSIGYSLRATNNSYLDLKVGYTISSAVNDSYETSSSRHECEYGNARIMGFLFSICYTYTFKWGERNKN